MRMGVSKMFSENSAAKETNAAEAAQAENELETTQLEGVDAIRCKQLLVRDTASKELKPLTDRVNMELATLKNLKNEFMRIMLAKCHVSHFHESFLNIQMVILWTKMFICWKPT